MPTITLSAQIESWPVRGSFTLSRGAKTEAVVVVCRLMCDGRLGQGECVPYARYGETPDSVMVQIEAARHLVESGAGRAQVLAAMAPGAARNAVDCALWDLEAKLSGRRVHSLVCRTPPRPLTTAYTISLGEPEEMAAAARAHANWPVLKLKLGGEGDVDRMRAVAAVAPAARIIADANESWSEDNLHALMMAAAGQRIALIEQPLPAGCDAMLATIPHPVPVCADESAHTAADLEGLRGRYDAVNVKLDKAGGLSEALAMRDRAHEFGFAVMVGCMVATSLSMAPAVLVAQEAHYVDLDGAHLLARDRPHGLSYSASLVSPPRPALWG